MRIFPRWRWVIEIVAAVLLVELLLGGYRFWTTREVVWFRDGAVSRKAAPDVTGTQFNNGLRLSPYYGYVTDFGVDGPAVFDPKLEGVQKEVPHSCTDAAVCEQLKRYLGVDWLPGFDPPWQINACGFASAYQCPSIPTGNALVVGVFGSSLAQGYATWAYDNRSAVLKDLARRTGRRLAIMNFTMGGFKQPQQLQSLAYALAIGQRFDLIINIDGFNEVYVSWLNANNYKTAASMPFAKLVVGQEKLFADELLARETATARSRRDQFAKNADSTHSAILLYSFSIIRDHYASSLADSERDIGQRRNIVRSPVQLTPARDGYSLPDVVNIWANSSISMAAMARAHGAAYVHVLQPSQYYSARKFSDQEISEFNILGEGDAPLRTIVPPAYEAFRAQAARLIDAGVHFVDATGIYEHINRGVYFDWCCHINEPGNVILDKFIQEHVLAAVEKRTIPLQRNPVPMEGVEEARHQFDLSNISDLKAQTMQALESSSTDAVKSIAVLNEVVQRAAAAHSRGVPDTALLLADTYVALAKVYVSRNDISSAMGQFRNAAAAIGAALAAKPDDRVVLIKQIEIYLVAGPVFLQAKSLGDAKSYYETAATLTEQLLKADPGNSSLRQQQDAAAAGLSKLRN